MTSSEGVPSRSVMSSSWWTTLRPGNSGLPSSTSAKMQPIDQMSIAGLYFAKNDPHSSGARYLCSIGRLSHNGYQSHVVECTLCVNESCPHCYRLTSASRHSLSRRWWSACR